MNQDVFNQMAGATVQGRGVKIQEDANFIIRIDRIKMEKSNLDRSPIWVAEFTVLEGTTDNPPGSERSWVQWPVSRAQTDPGNIKAFIAALENISDPNNAVIPSETFMAACGDSQPYAGRMLRLATQMVLTKSQRLFCVHNWSHYDGPAPSGATVPSKPSTTVSAPAPSATTTAAPPVVPVPSVPVQLTEAQWKAGQGVGQQHPSNPAYEWNPEHPEWGVRPKA